MCARNPSRLRTRRWKEWQEAGKHVENARKKVEARPYKLADPPSF